MAADGRLGAGWQRRGWTRAPHRDGSNATEPDGLHMRGFSPFPSLLVYSRNDPSR